jgi:hypothetical protein
VRCLDDDLQSAEAFLEHYSITEWDISEVAMQDAARHALSHYCSLFNGVADGLDLKYYPCRSTGSTRGMIVSPVGEGNPELNSMVNLVVVLNTELDHALDELGKARSKIAELCAQHRAGPSTAIRRVVPLFLFGLSTLTSRRPMVIMLMASLTAGPR